MKKYLLLSAEFCLLFLLFTTHSFAGKCSDCHPALIDNPFYLEFTPLIDVNSVFYSPCEDYNQLLAGWYHTMSFLAEREYQIGYLHDEKREFEKYYLNFRISRDLYRDFFQQPITSWEDFQHRAALLEDAIDQNYREVKSARLGIPGKYIFALIILALLLLLLLFRTRVFTPRKINLILIWLLTISALIAFLNVRVISSTDEIPDIANASIDSLRSLVDSMALMNTQVQQIKQAALVAGQSPSARGWMKAAEERFSRMNRLNGSDIRPLIDKINDSELSKTEFEEVKELKGEAYSYISPTAKGDFLLAKLKLDIEVPFAEWEEIAEQLLTLDDSFPRNSLILALVRSLQPYNEALADKYAKKIDDPYFKILYAGFESEETENYFPGSSEEIDPAKRFEICLYEAGQKKSPRTRMDVISVVAAFEDSLKRAYYAARAIEKVDSLSDEEFLKLLDYAKAAGAKLEAKCWLTHMHRGFASPKMLGKAFTRFQYLPEEIREVYPRDEFYLWQGYFIGRESIEAGLDFVSMTETESMYQFGLEKIAGEYTGASDEAFGLITKRMSDPSALMNAYLNRIEALILEDDTKREALTALNGLWEEVLYAEPKIKLIAAWAEIDPVKAEERLLGLNDDDDYIRTLELLANKWKNTHRENILILIEHKYDSLKASDKYTKIEKADYLRKLAGAMILIDRRRGLEMLGASLAGMTGNEE